MRTEICRKPVMPGFRTRYADTLFPYLANSLVLMGRGPTKLISHFSTFQICGSLSRLVLPFKIHWSYWVLDAREPQKSFLNDGLRVSVNEINGLGEGFAVCRAEARPNADLREKRFCSRVLRD